MRSPALTAAVLLVAAAGCSSSHGPSGPQGGAAGATCASGSECAPGLFCFESTCASSYAASAACAPPGPAPAITGGGTVGPATYPGCVTPVAAPVYPTADGSVVDLGVQKVGATVSFAVGPGTLGFSIVLESLEPPPQRTIGYLGYTLPNTPVPTDVKRPPGGSLVYSDTVSPPLNARGYPDGTGTLAWFMGAGPAIGIFTVPNTSRSIDLVLSAGQLPSGSWSFVVNDWAYECRNIQGCTGGSDTGTYHVYVLTRASATAPALRSTGKLDLEVYLATSSTTFPGGSAQAASDPHVARVVETMRSYYSAAGICIGSVTFHDLPGWAKQLYAPSGIVNIGGSPPCDPLSQLFTLAVAGTGPAVHLFLADKLVDTSGGMAGYTTLGVDGAIPGPSGVPGTVTGGAIVGVFDQLGFELAAGACSGGPDPGSCGADLVAYVAAHEAGHWLGLYHTTEATGDLFDPIADTASCPCLSCAPLYQRVACSELSSALTPTLMENRFCTSASASCGGGRNLMFWLVDEKLSTGELTREQGEVMRLNPAVH